ncbi:5-formyltetrahydrofolate cyclo-ligase [Bifidobacterium sp. 64T4]|uniref:5-formyltetrahydrofolate cyclo-ligase n=1 Tax=Bifidobacterium pongonis TaxID=2834432 RepID=UPI001C55D3DF|nr:5-formyltetrahydrofolate cyclo-ligase [Bifidobacterium pongonis]MBW3094677.1 5-formyltetrahydrofolate cyclo-ligase [Bifidobacterium pongonis]
MGTNETKRMLRRNAIARRTTTDAAQRLHAGEALARHIGELPLPDHPCTVAAYVSMGSEVETRPLLHALAERGHRILLPRLGTGLDIGWGEFGDTPLEDYGERRPQEPAGATLNANILGCAALVLLPALLVDASGTRLGRGGGWYDRALAHCTPGTPLVAVCWPWETGVAQLPHESHDVPVTATLTPLGYAPIAAPAAVPAVRAAVPTAGENGGIDGGTCQDND